MGPRYKAALGTALIVGGVSFDVYAQAHVSMPLDQDHTPPFAPISSTPVSGIAGGVSIYTLGLSEFTVYIASPITGDEVAAAPANAPRDAVSDKPKETDDAAP